MEADGMLVLARKIGEEIQIGEDVTLVVTEIKGKRVRLGIKAPAGVTVLRGELQRRTALEEAAARRT